MLPIEKITLGRRDKMSYEAPKIEVVSLVHKADESGKDTASCCSGSCCYGYDSGACSTVFWG